MFSFIEFEPEINILTREPLHSLGFSIFGTDIVAVTIHLHLMSSKALTGIIMSITGLVRQLTGKGLKTGFFEYAKV